MNYLMNTDQQHHKKEVPNNSAEHLYLQTVLKLELIDIH